MTRKSKKLSIAVYTLLPLVMTLFVWPNLAGGNRGGTWFAWVKSYSALAGVLIFMGIRYIPALAKKKWMLFLPAAILVVNIIEAIIAELECASMKGELISGLIWAGPGLLPMAYGI